MLSFEVVFWWWYGCMDWNWWIDWVWLDLFIGHPISLRGVMVLQNLMICIWSFLLQIIIIIQSLCALNYWYYLWFDSLLRMSCFICWSVCWCGVGLCFFDLGSEYILYFNAFHVFLCVWCIWCILCILCICCVFGASEWYLYLMYFMYFREILMDNANLFIFLKCVFWS